MLYAINVGKMTSARYGMPAHLIAESRIIAAIHKAGFQVRSMRSQISDTEETITAIVGDENPFSFYGVRRRIESLADDLKQDCIAVVPVMSVNGLSHNLAHNSGALIGPFAESWGAFDKTKFIEV